MKTYRKTHLLLPAFFVAAVLLLWICFPTKQVEARTLSQGAQVEESVKDSLEAGLISVGDAREILQGTPDTTTQSTVVALEDGALLALILGVSVTIFVKSIGRYI